MEGTVGGAADIRQFNAHVDFLATGDGSDVAHATLEDPSLRGDHLHQMIQFEISWYLLEKEEQICPRLVSRIITLPNFE